MPFGKFKGYELDEIESNYLVYAIENFDLPDELIDSMKQILRDRLGIQSHFIGIFPDTIRKIYKKLAKQYHPDKGGSDLAMQALNEFKNELL